MALKKLKTIKGIDCEYWVIASVATSRFNKCSEIVVRLYVNKAARDADEDNYLDVMTVRIDKYITSGTVEAYTELKQAPTLIEYDDQGDPIITRFFEYAMDV